MDLSYIKQDLTYPKKIKIVTSTKVQCNVLSSMEPNQNQNVMIIDDENEIGLHKYHMEYEI
jgi:hypothetical protein